MSSPGLASANTIIARLERLIFGHRALILVLFSLVTAAMLAISVRGLHIDASFTKQLPTQHEYMRTYLDPKVAEFRGANRVLIALVARDGNMFTPEFFSALRKATDEVIVMDGIDRGSVQSLFTPNVRYLEVVEDGIEAGNVIPADFKPTPEGMAHVRDNILKAGIVGRLVANDFSGALVSAIVLEQDAKGRPVDPIRVAHDLEQKIRAQLDASALVLRAGDPTGADRGANAGARARPGADADASRGADASANHGVDADANRGAIAEASRGADADASRGADASAGRGADADASRGADADASRGADADASRGADAGVSHGADADASRGADADASRGADPGVSHGADPGASRGASVRRGSDPSADPSADPSVGHGVDVHIIGFAKVMGDIADGALSVVVFAVITLVLTLLAVWLYCLSFRVALVPVVCSLIAVVWQLGMLVLLGYGIDPLGLLVPFLIFAIGVSHGVQKISAIGHAALAQTDCVDAARRVFRQLLVPAVIALLADLVGFITILLIPVEVIREMAITASIGVAIVILTDLVLLPVLVSYVTFDPAYRARVERRHASLAGLWHWVAKVTQRGPAAIVIAIAIILAVLGWWKGRETPIGDTQAGVPELRPHSRYNLDSDVITAKFSIGVDVLTVIVESKEPICVSHDLMAAVDRFGWHMQNVAGVQDVLTLPFVAKIAIAGWNEGSLKWRSIPREQTQLTQSTRYIETSTGLLNADCNIVPVLMFLRDHKAGTIERVIAAVKRWRTQNPVAGAKFELATGNVGAMAATNETVEAKEFWILAGVFATVILMCLITFRSVLGTVLVVLPLALVSVLVYAVMAMVGIGLKVSTLPMVALGAGIGVDYGIYLFSRMQEFLRQGFSVQDAYERTLGVTGASIIVTGITLAIGVATWVFSPLKFQADIGVMLTFMFLVNMLAAIILLPALAAWLIRPAPRATSGAAR